MYKKYIDSQREALNQTEIVNLVQQEGVQQVLLEQ